MNQFRAWSACALVGALALSACGSDDESTETTTAVSPAIVVVASSDPMTQVVAEIYAQALENSGFRVGRKDAVADGTAAYDAVVAGTAQLTPVRSAELLGRVDPEGSATDEAIASTTTTSTLAPDDTATDDTATDDTATDDTATDDTATTSTTIAGLGVDVEVAALDASLPDAVVVGGPSAADDRWVVACTAAITGDGAVSTIGDLAEVDGGVRLAAPEGFEEAVPFGLASLDSVYGFVPAEFTALPADGIEAAIADDTADCLVVRGTSSVVLQQSLVVLTDDLGAIPSDVVLPLLTTAAATPDLLSVLDGISAQLSTDILRSLLVKIEVDGKSPDAVAQEFFSATSSATS